MATIVPTLSSKKSGSNAYEDPDGYLDKKTWENDQYQWLEPTKEQAKEHSRNKKIKSGTSPLCGSGTDTLSSGNVLYFRFLKYLVFMFLVMTFCATPHMIFFYSGSRTPDEKVDSLQLVRFTAGNMGFNIETVNKSSCVDCNGTMIEVFGKTFRATDASLIICLGDFVYSVLFLFFISFFYSRIKTITEESDSQSVSATDYSIFVRGLPENATAEEVRLHFSDLYNLDNPDWTFNGFFCGLIARKKRPRTADLLDANGQKIDVKPTLVPPESQFPNNVFTQHAKEEKIDYTDSWVAEVALAHPNGEGLRASLRLKNAALKLREARAAVKKYSANTTFKQGPNKTKEAVAKSKLEVLEKKLANFEQKMKNPEIAKAEAVCIGAYVVFNNEESFLRCLHDYKNSKTSRGRLFQPTPLRFRGKFKLSIEKAPEPSNILWENLETSRQSRFFRRTIVNLITFALIIISFALIFSAQVQKVKFSERLPVLGLCNPSATDSLGYIYKGASANPQRSRDQDSLCEDRFDENHHFISYVQENNTQLFSQKPSNPCTTTNRFNATFCENNAFISNCEKYFATGCVDVRDLDTKCNRLGRSPAGFYCDSEELGRDWPKKCYSLSNVVGCYCRDTLLTTINELGVYEGVRKIVNEESVVCGDFATAYALGKSLEIAASFSVVIVNTILKSVLISLARFERHHSVSKESSAVVGKIFVAQFLNTALVILVINANLDRFGIEKIGLDKLGIGDGPYDDFTIEWYHNVGIAITMTMFIQIWVPHIGTIVQFILAPIKRFQARKCASQTKMNSLYEGPEFRVEARYPMILTTLFVTMLYSSGLPFLLPIAVVNFLVSYWVDKIALLRLYNKPPAFDNSLALKVYSLLPYALILHLSFGVYMYGNNDVLRSELLDPSMILGDTETDPNDPDALQREYEAWLENTEGDALGVVPRIMRKNVFPIFLLLVFCTLAFLFSKIAGPLLKKILLFKLRILTCGIIGRNNRVAPQREFNPPFTGEYKKAIDPTHASVAKECGWEVGEDPLTKKVFQFKVREGRILSVWEVIGENALFSYDIEANPKYRSAIIAQRMTKEGLTTPRQEDV